MTFPLSFAGKVKHTSTLTTGTIYLVVISSRRLFIGWSQGLELGVQDVQQLLNQLDGHADVTGVDPPPRQVDQLPSDVGCVFPAFNLERGSVRGGGT